MLLEPNHRPLAGVNNEDYGHLFLGFEALMLRGGDLTLPYTLLYVQTIQWRQQIKLFCIHTTVKKYEGHSAFQMEFQISPKIH